MFCLVRSIRGRRNLGRLISRNALSGSLRNGLLNVDDIALRYRVLHDRRLYRSLNRLNSRLHRGGCRNGRIRGGKHLRISERRVILQQIIKVICGELIHVNRRKLRRNRLTRQAIRRGRLLLQVNAGIGIHAAQLANHHGASSRSVARLQRLRNSAALSTQTLHSATPQRHTTHQRQHRLKARLTHRREQTHQ